LSERLDVPFDAIVIGPGAEALLAPCLRTMGVSCAVVPVPAFSEYRRVCEQEEVELLPLALDRNRWFHPSVEDLTRADALILNNPHNPSGALLTRDEVLQIASCGARVLLDEAFIDYAPHASAARDAVANARLIVVRSLTKFYGCPGLRVGYAVAHPEVASAIAQHLPAWPVTQLAINALAAAVTDVEYTEATLRENAERREGLRAGLEALCLTVFPSAANYLLVELPAGKPNASFLRQRLLARHGVLIRNCDSYEGLAAGRYIRVAVLAEEDNVRLLAALAAELTK
jgi:threonine-phosphate decarboxylase